MSKPDKRYYKINIHGQEQVFTNVEKVDKGYIANGVDNDGKAYQFYHRLSQEQIDSAIISNSMVFVEKPTDVVFRFYLVNASEYDNGNKETSGIWLEFPADIKRIENALEDIGLPPDAEQGQYFIDECQCILKSLNPLVNVRTDIHELAKTAERLDTFDGFQMMKLDAVMQTAAKFNNLAEIREFTHNDDYYVFEMDKDNPTELGLYFIYDSGMLDSLPDHYKDAINPTAFANYIIEAEHGVFTSKGYLYPSGDEWNCKELPFFRPNSLIEDVDDKLIDTTEIFAVDLDSFFRETSDEYSNMFDDVVKAQKHIADYIRTNNTAQVKQIIHGMKKEHHLSEDEIQPYLDRLDNFDKNKGIEKDYNFIAVITNAEDYLKGDFESVKIYLPTDKETVSRAFEEIGLLPHAVQGEYMFDDFHLYSEKLHSVIKPTESLDELNYFSALVFRMDDGMCDRFMNEIEKDKNIKNLTDLINHANKTLGLAARYNGDKSTIPTEYRVTMEPASIKRSIKKQLEENKGKTADVPASPTKNKKNDLEV